MEADVFQEQTGHVCGPLLEICFMERSVLVLEKKNIVGLQVWVRLYLVIYIKTVLILYIN